MKKLILTTILIILANTIYADGITDDIEQYLGQYPDRISPDGWVIFPANILIDNVKDFSTECEYRVYTAGNRWLTHGYVSAKIARFVWPHCPFKHVYLKVTNDRKNDLVNEQKETEIYQITKLEEKCPSYLRYIKKKEQEEINKLNVLLHQIDVKINQLKKSQDSVELIVKMDTEIKKLKKQANKTCYDNCVIL
ncbi:MAG: hypothetical protein HRT87_03305 [Legionellales bacterium]|nr:hypothetical protein [Legionellales bacterium]